jgi:hypothetical protein
MIKLLVLYSSPLPCYLVPLRPKYLPQHPILDTLSLSSYLDVREPVLVLHLHKTQFALKTLRP